MPRAAARPKPAPAYRRLANEARRTLLLARARAAFTEQPYEELTMRELAARAGSSKALLFHYFPTKQDLYLAVLEQIADDLITRVRAVPPALVPVERVRASLDAYLDHAEAHQPAYQALVRSPLAHAPAVQAILVRTRDAMFTQLAGAPAVASIAAQPRFALAMRGWIGFVEASTLAWCDGHAVTRLELRELMLGRLVHALRWAGLPAADGSR